MKTFSQFESKLHKAIDEFNIEIQKIENGVRSVPKSKTEFKNVSINQLKLKNSFKQIFRDKNNISKIGKNLQLHFNDLRPFISLCSSPKAFRTAWNLRSSALSDLDAEAITNDGGQLVPFNSSTRFLKYEQQGVLLSDYNYLHAVRHSEGNYDDELDEFGRFTYQPPSDVSGMMRYRWGQILSKNLNIPYVIICIMWFQFRINTKLNQVFLLSPAKIIDFDDDLKDLNKSFHNPLKLELLQRSDAYIALNQIKSLDNELVDVDIRNPLDDKLAREWSYDKINTGKKGIQIKNWAKKNLLKCPGEICGNTTFENLRNQDIAFGHIISQNWSSAFTFVLEKVNHPDNLYLTCKKCNSSLSDNFPDKKLKRNITNTGTIGDWLRNHEKQIREI